MSDNKKILSIACVYSGTVLGAGFATGQEILRYFIRFGAVGMLGLIVGGVLFAIVGYKVLWIAHKAEIKDYRQMAEYLLGKTMGRCMEVVVALFLMVLFSTMLAASGETINEVFGIKKILGAIIAAVLCFVTFLYRVDGLVRINSLLCPILVMGGMAIGLVMYFTDSIPTGVGFGALSDNIAVSTLVYVSYNIITAVSLLVTMSGMVSNRRVAKYSGYIGGGSMAILGICIALPLLKYFGIIENSGLPILKLTMERGTLLRYIYIVILFAAIFTTAIGNGFAMIEWVHSRVNIPEKYISITVCLLGVVLSGIGFVGLVGKVYMIFGYVGLAELMIILFAREKNN